MGGAGVSGATDGSQDVNDILGSDEGVFPRRGGASNADGFMGWYLNMRGALLGYRAICHRLVEQSIEERK